MKYPEITNYIDGRWRSGRGVERVDVVNPADESVLTSFQACSIDDLGDAVDAAARGLAIWRQEPAQLRARVLQRAGQIIAERREVLAEIMSLEQGKPLIEARGELDRSVETFEWFAGEATRVSEIVYPAHQAGIRQTSVPEPVGVVAAFTAWNFPSILIARKLAPALAAGCAVVLKASEETPGTAVETVRILQEAGVPPGVVNLVFGEPDEISRYLLDQAVVRKVSFTGSVPVGKLLAERAAKHMMRCTFELGGHAPCIVLPDVDVESVAEQTGAFKFRNAGQVCTTVSRFFVHKDVYEPFVEAMTRKANNIRLGDGLSDGVEMGPMANARRIEAMRMFVDDAREHGARLMAGGERHGNVGYFWQPTVLADVPDKARLMREEPFGPIAAIAPYLDVDDAVQRANSLDYGLAAYVFGGDLAKAQAIGDRLDAGIVGVNCMTPMLAHTPAGGVKASGYGYEGGRECLDAYLQLKLVSTPENTT